MSYPKLSILFLALCVCLVSTEARYVPLWSYSGQWQVTESNKKRDLLNQCVLNGQYFVCQQSVDGAVSELLVIVSTGTPGHFGTQSVLPDGRAGGKGGLEISGNRWIFTSSWNQGGRTKFYKTVNTFLNQTKIHFEQQESDNNSDWKTTNSGDEVRVKSGLHTVVR